MSEAREKFAQHFKEAEIASQDALIALLDLIKACARMREAMYGCSKIGKDEGYKPSDLDEMYPEWRILFRNTPALSAMVNELDAWAAHVAAPMLGVIGEGEFEKIAAISMRIAKDAGWCDADGFAPPTDHSALAQAEFRKALGVS